MTIGGVQLIMIGIVGEYIGKILSELKARPIYFVAEHSVKHFEGRQGRSILQAADTSSQDFKSASSQDGIEQTAAE